MFFGQMVFVGKVIPYLGMWFHLIFTPFTGINHHRQSTTFGVGLITNEKSDSFVWLFEKFLEAMGGHKSTLIITDQDPSVKVAIDFFYPSTKN